MHATTRSPPKRDGTLFRLEVPHSKLHGAKHDVLLYQVVNTDNELLLRSADAPRHPLPVPLSTGFREYAGLRIYTLAHPSLPMYIHAGDPLAHRQATRTRTLLGFAGAAAGGVAAAGLADCTVTRRVLAPAGQIARELQQRDGRHLAPLAPAQPPPAELQTIVGSANHLLQRLEGALDTERALAANAAHELRTPGHRAPAPADRAGPGERRPRTPARGGGAGRTRPTGPAQRKAAAALACRVGRGLAQERVNLGKLAAVVAQEFWSDPALLQRLHLVLPESEDVWVRGDFDALAIALRNLVENAVRYAPSGPVTIAVEAPATCSVSDEGPGFPRARARAAAAPPAQRPCAASLQHASACARLRAGPVDRIDHRAAPGRRAGPAVAPARPAHGLRAALVLRAADQPTAPGDLRPLGSRAATNDKQQLSFNSNLQCSASARARGVPYAVRVQQHRVCACWASRAAVSAAVAASRAPRWASSHQSPKPLSPSA